MRKDIFLFVFLFLVVSVSGCIEMDMLGISDSRSTQERAVEAGNPAICDQASHPDVCYTAVAVSEADPSICVRISDSGMRSTCEYRASSAEPTDTGDCKYDSECPSICEGDVRWNRGCNPRTGECIKTFDYPCKEHTDTFGDYSFGRICVGGECVRDDASVNAKKAELQAEKKQISDEVKDMLAAKQELQEVWIPYYYARCHNALADVTNKLIIDTAMMLRSPPSKFSDITSSTSQDLINTMLSQTTESTTEMSPEEFIAWNCNFYNALYQDLAIYDTKIEHKQAEVREINEQLAEFP